MKVIILAAGYGTRLYPLTKNIPKPLLPIADKPLLNFTIENAQKIEDVDKIFVISNSKFYRNFKDWLGLQKFNKSVEILNDGSTSNDNRLGAIKDLQWCIETKKIEDSVLVLGGDNLYTFDMQDFVSFYKTYKKNVVAVTDLKDISKARNFGVVEYDDSFRITSFIEKSVYTKTSVVAICAYIFTPDIKYVLKDYASGKNNLDAPGYFVEWLYRRYEVFAYNFNTPWFDIGDIDSYKSAKEYIEKKSN